MKINFEDWNKDVKVINAPIPEDLESESEAEEESSEDYDDSY